MLWFDPSLQMHAAGDAWEMPLSFYDKTTTVTNDLFAPSARSKRAMEYAAHYSFYHHHHQHHHPQQHHPKYTRYEMPMDDTPISRREKQHCRRVRFVPDNELLSDLDCRPMIHIVEIPNRFTLTPEQKRSMWYNGHDIRTFFKDARKAQDRVRALNGCRCLQIRKCPTCRHLWRMMD